MRMRARPNPISMRQKILIIIPLALGGAALETGILFYKLGVPASCGAILIWVWLRGEILPRGIPFVLVAFFFSMVGDGFLSNKSDHPEYFILGIGAFFLAHVGYLAFALAQGRVNRLCLAVLLSLFIPYYLLGLAPAISDLSLSGSVLVYLLVSCLSLSAAFGLRLSRGPKIWYGVGITLIVISDTFISFNEFMGFQAFNALILPTYYLAHICVTLSAMAMSGKPRIGWETVRAPLRLGAGEGEA